MYLSELYEHLGQLLKKHGDMQVSNFEILRSYDSKTKFNNYILDNFFIYKENDKKRLIINK